MITKQIGTEMFLNADAVGSILKNKELNKHWAPIFLQPIL